MAKHLHTITISENKNGTITTDIGQGRGNLVTLYGMLEYARRRLDIALAVAHREAQEKANDKESRD